MGQVPPKAFSLVLLPPPAATPIDKLFSLSFYTLAYSPPRAGRSAPCYLPCDPKASVLRALPQHWLPEPLHPAASSSSQSLSATALASTQKWSASSQAQLSDGPRLRNVCHLFMFVCACEYTRACVYCVHVCILCRRVHTFTCAWDCLHMHVHVFVYTRVCCVYTCVCPCDHVPKHLGSHTAACLAPSTSLLPSRTVSSVLSHEAVAQSSSSSDFSAVCISSSLVPAHYLLCRRALGADLPARGPPAPTPSGLDGATPGLGP